MSRARVTNTALAQPPALAQLPALAQPPALDKQPDLDKRPAGAGTARRAGYRQTRHPGAVMPMSVVDAHHHLWDLSAHDQPWLASDAELAPLLRNFTVADLATETAAQDVTATVLVQTVSEPWETPEMLALAAAGALVTAVVGWVD